MDFFNDKSPKKGPGQTHIFTSFPNSAIDPDDEHHLSEKINQHMDIIHLIISNNQHFHYQ